MKRKIIIGIIAGFLGFVVGIFGGGFLGLVIGGTFLGGLEIHEQTGIEGYELAAYIGAIIGAIILPILGVGLALLIEEKTRKNL